MRILLSLWTVALLLPMVTTPAVAEVPTREVLFEKEYADAFVGNEQGWVVFSIPDGYVDVRLEVGCAGNVGAFALHEFEDWTVSNHVCDGLQGKAVGSPLEAGRYYYGVASFTGLNGVTVRVTGIPA